MARSNKHKKVNHVNPEGEKEFIEVGRKLGISIPAGLMLLVSMNVDVAAHTQDTTPDLKASAEIQKLSSNEVADQLLGYAKNGVIIASAADCSGIHGDTHVNKDDPNITVDGKHSNVHTNTHGDSCRN